ncbi:MAG: DUF4845 domain-containing protein [Nitrincola lacisaponensis]|uniref:DUF4845 domain-containing protein n=1 Tax=Nitrincola lacisaponensis TaxID=267850 RepID=A0A063Y4Y0_9GAMM|nr:DUF4845 domain-containing protein [Nitrincola lacisaponensis]KDE39562.1 hypothetical protein ADINL_2016 [Nitrincola lacisaponensis]
MEHHASHRQAGASFFGVLSILIVLGVVLTVAFKLFTPYWEYRTITSVVKATTEDREELARPIAQIRTNLDRRFHINQVSLPDRDALTITEDAGMIFFNLDYEVRVPMFGNVDAVIMFQDSYEARKP